MEKTLEVEQKFRVPENYREVLETAGAEKVGERILSDLYMDTKEFVLLRQDVWLRERYLFSSIGKFNHEFNTQGFPA